MNKTLICIGVAAISLSAGASQKLDRTKQIWQYAHGRMLVQQDVWFDEGDYPATIQLLKVEGEESPADYDVWTNLGWMQENVEEWDAALATYIRYRRGNPAEVDAALPEADYFSRKKLYNKIPELLEPAIKRPGCHPNNFRLLARAYERQKMYADSVRVWKMYLQRSPTDGAAKANLARVEKELGPGT